MELLSHGATPVRRTLPWDPEALKSASLEQLGERHSKLYYRTSASLEKLQHAPSNSSAFWSRYATIGGRWPEIISIQAHAELLQFLAGGLYGISCLEDWVLSCRSDKYQIRYLAHRQISDIAARRAGSPTHRDDGEGLVRLFMRCKDGLCVFIGNFEGDVHAEHTVMSRRMRDMYFPDQMDPYRDEGWDPVLGERVGSICSSVFHLYPWRQADSMRKIFISGPPVDVFAPENGLFLHETFQRGLEHGVLAIIPEVGVDRSSTEFRERREEWWRNSVKEYQIVVIDAEHPKTFEPRFAWERRQENRLLDFQGRKLVFNGDFRPDVRYMWWAFLSAVTVASWRRKGHPTEVGRINSAIRNAMRYWGTPKGLIDDKVVSSFMATIAESTENLLNDEQQATMRRDRDDLGVAVVAFERANAFRDEREDNDFQYEDYDDNMFKYGSGSEMD